MSVPEAINLTAQHPANQPLLFRLQEQYYLKVDKQAIRISNVSCLCDANELLVKIHYIFNFDYEYELKPTYGLLEKAWGLPVSVGNSAALNDFVRQALENSL